MSEDMPPGVHHCHEALLMEASSVGMSDQKVKHFTHLERPVALFSYRLNVFVALTIY
jgi:hypothetical protein